LIDNDLTIGSVTDGLPEPTNGDRLRLPSTEASAAKPTCSEKVELGLMLNFHDAEKPQIYPRLGRDLGVSSVDVPPVF
jgi:hypothetical protein